MSFWYAVAVFFVGLALVRLLLKLVDMRRESLHRVAMLEDAREHQATMLGNQREHQAAMLEHHAAMLDHHAAMLDHHAAMLKDQREHQTAMSEHQRGHHAAMLEHEREHQTAMLTEARTANSRLETLSLKVAAAVVSIQQSATSEHARLLALEQEYNKGYTDEPEPGDEDWGSWMSTSCRELGLPRRSHQQRVTTAESRAVEDARRKFGVIHRVFVENRLYTACGKACNLTFGTFIFNGVESGMVPLAKGLADEPLIWFDVVNRVAAVFAWDNVSCGECLFCKSSPPSGESTA